MYVLHPFASFHWNYQKSGMKRATYTFCIAKICHPYTSLFNYVYIMPLPLESDTLARKVYTSDYIVTFIRANTVKTRIKLA